MEARSPTQPDGTARVVKFSPRTLDTRPGHQPHFGGHLDAYAAREQPGSVPHGERSSGQADDFQHRMWTNAAAFAIAVTLTAIGIWLATSIADLRKSQDCALTGRRDCVTIVAPHS